MGVGIRCLFNHTDPDLCSRGSRISGLELAFRFAELEEITLFSMDYVRREEFRRGSNRGLFGMIRVR